MVLADPGEADIPCAAEHRAAHGPEVDGFGVVSRGWGGEGEREADGASAGKRYGLVQEGKMFLLTDMTDSRWINVKCDPDRAVELRETYEEVSPGWHMNKRHWNTVRTDGDLPAGLIREWIRDSYLLVVKSLPKTIRDEIRNAYVENNENR